MSLFRTMFARSWAKYAGIPGPDPSLPFGNLSEFFRRWPWEVCADWGRAYGGMTLAWMGANPTIVLNEPSLIEQALQEGGQFYKADPFDAVAPVIGADDLFISNGARWAELRSSNPFSQDYAHQWLQQLTPRLNEFVAGAIDGWAGRTIGDVNELVLRLVYDLITLAVWGEPLGDASFEQFMKLARTGDRRMLAPNLLAKLRPLDPRFYSTRKLWFDEFLKRAGRPGPSGSFLALAQQAKASSAAGLMKALAAPILFGGAFSVTASITHTLRFLSQSPDNLARLQSELRDRLSAFPQAVDGPALARCESLDWALRESLRLAPPVAIYSRNVNVNESVELGGHTLPPNTNLLITNWLLHHDPVHWNDPWTYRPERWGNGGMERNPLGSGYFFPFGRGPRACIGQSLALAIGMTVLAQVLTRLQISAPKLDKLESAFFFAVQSPKRFQATFARYIG